MDLTQLTDEQLQEEFAKASANRQSLTPLINEKARRMNITAKTSDPEVVDPGTENICVSCE